MMPILVKGDDVRSGRKAKTRYGRHWRQWVKIILCLYAAEVHTNSSVFLISISFSFSFRFQSGFDHPGGVDEQGLLDRAREVTV